MTAAIWADFKTSPYIHQLREFETSCETKARALLWQMRTGKTKVMIDTACHLYKEGEIDAVLLIAPNGVHENWTRRELPIHHWDTVPRDTLTWNTEISGEKGIDRVRAHERRGWHRQHDAWWDRAKRLLGTKDRLPWFALASSSMTRPDTRRIVQRIFRRRKRVLVIFDESHDFRSPGSTRTKMARAIGRKAAYTRILTGTPVENSPLAAFTQFQLLHEGALGFDTYAKFKDHHATYELKTNFKTKQSYPALVGYKNLDELRDRMAKWSSVVLRSDCEDLPDLIRSRREIELTEEQTRIYRELHHAFELEVGGKLVSIGENTQRLVKLKQVVSGFLRDEYGDVHSIPGKNPRMDALIDEVELTSSKVVIWCAFHEDMDRVCETLRARGHKIVEYHGRISSGGKRRAREAFEPGAENDVKALVGYPTAGLDMSEAEKIIWYSHVFDAIKRSQADERATAMGGENVPVIDLTAPGVDPYILDNVIEKVSVADALARDGLQEVLRRIAL